jgi:hypothetical protein
MRRHDAITVRHRLPTTLAVSSSHPRLPSAAPTRSFSKSALSNDRSTQDPPPPADEAWVLRVTLSTLSLGDSGDSLPPGAPYMEATSMAPCLRSALHETATSVAPCPPEAPFIKSMAPCLPMHRHGRVGRFNVGPILVLFESLGSGLAATSVAPCLRSALHEIG